MTTEYRLLKSKVLDYLRDDRDGSLDLHGSLKAHFSGQGIELNDTDLVRIEQIVHELYVASIIVPGIKPRVNVWQSGAMIFPCYHLTEYGVQVLNNAEYQPYDPDGYLARIKTEVVGIDPVIVRYLEECLKCFSMNLMLAAATMLGCAAEKAVLLLVEAFGQSLSNEEEKQDYEKETKSFIISRKWNALWERLEPLSPSLPSDLRDDLGTILDRIFYIIRTTRNEAGHPTGRTIEKETVHANLLLFPIFCKRVYGLIWHFCPQ